MSALNKELLMDAVGMLDDELITNHLRMRERLQKRKAVAWKRSSLVAACLAVVMLIGYGASYIPKEYNFEGSEENSHLMGVAVKKDYWIYYVSESGLLQRERVRDYGSTESRFNAWKHFNGLGEDVQLVRYEHVNNNVVIYDEEGKHMGERLGDWHAIKITVSSDIKNYKNYEKKIQALEKTYLEMRDACYITIE